MDASTGARYANSHARVFVITQPVCRQHSFGTVPRSAEPAAGRCELLGTWVLINTSTVCRRPMRLQCVIDCMRAFDDTSMIYQV